MSTNSYQTDWLLARVSEMEQKGLVTRTFRRLDPSRQEAVMRAILDVSAEDGPTELSMSKVAEKAGVAVGSLYLYFPGKQGVLEFAISLTTATLLDLLEQGRPHMLKMPLREALSVFMNSGMEWGQAQMGAVKFFGRAAYQGDPELAESVVRPVAEALREVMEDILRAAETRGELRPGLDVPAASRLLYAITITTTDPLLLPYLNTYFQLYDAEITRERILDTFLDMIANGVLK